MLQRNQRVAVKRRLKRGLWSAGLSAVRFETLEPRTFLTVSVSDLDPSNAGRPSDWWYGANASTVEVANYTDPADGLVGMGAYLKSDHNELFTAKVGSFKDADAGSPADYRAVVRLDGHADLPVMIVRNAAGGFDVMATAQLSWGWHAFDVQISDARNGSRTSSFDSAAFVLAPAISGEAVKLRVRAGHVFEGVVGKYAGVDPALLDQYVATIDWGDGSRTDSTGTVELLDGKNAAIHGAHTYTTPGLHDITVYLTTTTATQMPKIESGGIMWGRRDQSDYPTGPNSTGSVGREYSGYGVVDLYIPNSYYNPYWSSGSGSSPNIEAKSQITVLRANLVGDSEASSMVASIRSTNTLAKFDVLDLDVSDLSRYQVIVELTPPASFHIVNGLSTFRAAYTVPATLTQNDRGQLEVTIDKMFESVGRHAFTVRILDTTKANDAQVGFLKGQFDNVNPLTVRVNEFEIVGGQSIDSPIARVHVEGENLWDSRLQLNVTNNLTDVELSARLVSLGNGDYDVYLNDITPASRSIGRLSLTLHITNVRMALNASDPPADESYEATDSVYRKYAPMRFDGFELDDADVVTTGLQTNLYDNAYDLTRGDFGIGLGTVGSESLDSSDIAGFVEWSDGTTTQITFETAESYDRGLWYNGGFTRRNSDNDRVDAGRAFSASAPINNLTPGIHTGKVVIAATGRRVEFTLEITVRQNDWSVPDAPESAPMPAIGEIIPQSFDAIRGQDWEGVVGNFIPNDPGANLSDYHASVVLEGISNEGRFVNAGNGSWNIVVRFVFSYQTTYDRDEQTRRTGTAEITVEKGTRSISDYGYKQYQVDIDPNQLNATGEGKTFRQFEDFTTTLAQFEAPNDSRDISDFRATIDWGDGTITEGVISTRYRGGYDVTGSHKYRTEGTFTPTVSIYRGGEYTRTRANLHMSHHPVDVTPEQPQTVGLAVGGTIATFVDGDLTGTIDLNQQRIKHAALIDWGDGTISTGDLVKRADGGFDVISQHAYAAAGDYTIAITVRQNVVYLPQISPWRNYDGFSYGGVSAFDSNSFSLDLAANKVPLLASAFVNVRVSESAPPAFGNAVRDVAPSSDRQSIATLVNLFSDDEVFKSNKNERLAMFE